MKVLTVFRHGACGEPPVAAGRLAWDRGRSYFEYNSDVLQRSLSLSPFQLQRHAQLQQAPGIPFAGLHGVFNDSLPDGWRLYLMDKHHQQRGIAVESLSPVDRLAYIGTRAMGALFYEPDEGDFFDKSRTPVKSRNPKPWPPATGSRAAAPYLWR